MYIYYNQIIKQVSQNNVNLGAHVCGVRSVIRVGETSRAGRQRARRDRYNSNFKSLTEQTYDI